MKSVIQLANRVRDRVRPAPAPAHDERVLVLFKNRAELKKAYGELQDELYRLKDRIKQQEGATLRVQEMLGALEARLGLVETAYPALVFYQLRALWQCARGILEQFVTDLARHRDERERRAFLAEHNRRAFLRRQEVEGNVREAQMRHVEVLGRMAELVAARARLKWLWHYFKRRDIDRQLHAAREAASAAERTLVEARAAVERLNEEPQPRFPGLSLDARRAINLAAIAYAEILCLRLADTPLVALAREATARREAADDYGERAECEALIAAIGRARTLLQARANIAQDVKDRSEQLKATVGYRNVADTAPVPESITLVEGDRIAGQPLSAKRAVRMPNVLAEDTWDLFRVLMR